MVCVCCLLEDTTVQVVEGEYLPKKAELNSADLSMYIYVQKLYKLLQTRL